MHVINTRAGPNSDTLEKFDSSSAIPAFMLTPVQSSELFTTLVSTVVLSTDHNGHVVIPSEVLPTY